MRPLFLPAIGIGIAGLWLATAASPTAQERRYELAGDRAAVYNLAGEIVVERGSGAAVVVEVTPTGTDAARLRVEQGRLNGRETLRVVYPGDRIVYRGSGGGSSDLRVQDDGTFGDGGRRVRIARSGDGIEAAADLRIRVPDGKRVEVYLAVGRVVAANVQGSLVIDTHAASVKATGTRGSLLIGVGSGSVEVADVEGDVRIDTGSGSVQLADVRADELRVDTGSGGVSASRVSASTLTIDTGSGGVDVDAAGARDVLIDTGSGRVNLTLRANPRSVRIDTGSGGVTMTVPPTFGAQLEVETGSGGIEVDFPVEMQRWERRHLRGTIGDGGAQVIIDTGSGGVRIVKGG
jgi:hypothetical protein